MHKSKIKLNQRSKVKNKINEVKAVKQSKSPTAKEEELDKRIHYRMLGIYY